MTPFHAICRKKVKLARRREGGRGERKRNETKEQKEGYQFKSYIHLIFGVQLLSIKSPDPLFQVHDLLCCFLDLNKQHFWALYITLVTFLSLSSLSLLPSLSISLLLSSYCSFTYQFALARAEPQTSRPIISLAWVLGAEERRVEEKSGR